MNQPNHIPILIAVIRKEFFLASRFALVGIIATLVHMSVVGALIELTLVSSPLLANLAAFLTAFVVSFTGHYHWTFQGPGNPRRAMKRMFVISSSAFAVNTVLLASLLKAGWMSASVSAIVAAAIVPAISFLASRFWGFKPSPTNAPFNEVTSKNEGDSMSTFIDHS
jgi:putative flippase GtrA